MSNTKLIGALAIAGGVLALGGTAMASGSNEDTADTSRTAAPQASSQHESNPTQHEFQNDHGDHYRGDHYRGEHHRGNPWPEFCSTKDPSISEERAQQIALEKVPGATVTEVDLDRCYGMEWQLELRKGNVEYDLDINADNGHIAEFEQEEDD